LNEKNLIAKKARNSLNVNLFQLKLQAVVKKSISHCGKWDIDCIEKVFFGIERKL